MKKTITFLAFSALLYNTSGQDMAATQRYFGGSQDERIQRITKYSDTEFLMVGRMDDPGSNPSGANMFALRTNVELASFNVFKVSTDSRDLAYASVAFDDGTFGLVGHTTENGASSTRDDGVFIRFNGQGDLLSQKSWGDNAGTTEVELSDMIRDENNVVIIGRTVVWPDPIVKGLVKKMTSTGFELWSFELEYPGESSFQRGIVAADGYYFVGYVRQSDNSFKTLLCKTDFNGILQYSRVYDLSGINTTSTTGGNTSLRAVVDAGDGLIIAHRYRNLGDDVSHTVIMKVDYTGSLIWRRRLQFGTGQNLVNAIKRGHEPNEFILVGETSSATDSWDATMYSISDSPQGPSLNWMRVFTGSESQRFFDVESFEYLGSTGYIAVGDIMTSSDVRDAWIVRTDQLGGGWNNEECWLANLPASLIEIPVSATDAGASLSPWNILSNHSFDISQPIVVPLNNDGLCQPLAFVASVESLEDFGGDIVVFPNPSSGEVYLRSDKYDGQPVMVEVFSVSGKTVFRQSDHLLNSQMPLRINHCPPGMYFIRIISPHGGQSQHKLILR